MTNPHRPRHNRAREPRGERVDPPRLTSHVDRLLWAEDRAERQVEQGRERPQECQEADARGAVQVEPRKPCAGIADGATPPVGTAHREVIEPRRTDHDETGEQARCIANEPRTLPREGIDGGLQQLNRRPCCHRQEDGQHGRHVQAAKRGAPLDVRSGAARTHTARSDGPVDEPYRQAHGHQRSAQGQLLPVPDPAAIQGIAGSEAKGGKQGLEELRDADQHHTQADPRKKIDVQAARSGQSDLLLRQPCTPATDRDRSEEAFGRCATCLTRGPWGSRVASDRPAQRHHSAPRPSAAGSRGLRSPRDHRT